jgi:hypothetical protein
MGSHDPFEKLKYKLWPKKKPEVKLLIWFLPTKSLRFILKYEFIDDMPHIIGKLSTRVITLF